MSARLLIACVCLVALDACRAPTDLGAKCDMYKGLPDGGLTTIREGEIKVGKNKDFISFGSTDCEDFTCVRDSTWVKDAGDGEIAKGYCSRVCELGSQCPAGDPTHDGKADLRLTCRALLLDPATLAAICSSSDGGTNSSCAFKSSTFCARGTAPDGGP